MKERLEGDGKSGAQKKGGFTRRDVLRVAGGLALAGTTFALDENAMLYRKRDLILNALMGKTEETNEAIEKGRKFLKDEYGIDVAFGDAWDKWFDAKDISIEEATNGLRIIIEEIGKYPQDFFKTNKLSSIRLAKDVVQVRSSTDAFSVGGFTEQSEKSIILGIDPGDPDFFGGSFHHEVYHVLDFARPGGVESNLTWDQVHEGCICTPNVHRQKYKGDAYAILDHAFIDGYGELSPLEERAEFARTMMMPKSHAAFLQRLKRENRSDSAILTRKYDAIREDYYEWSKGKMDDAFGKRLIESGSKSEKKQTSFNERFGTVEDDGFNGGATYK